MMTMMMMIISNKKIIMMVIISKNKIILMVNKKRMVVVMVVVTVTSLAPNIVRRSWESSISMSSVALNRGRGQQWVRQDYFWVTISIRWIPNKHFISKSLQITW